VGGNAERPADQLLSDDAYLRFIGDLSPEASFLTNRNPGNGNQNTSRLDDVGVWLGQKAEDQGMLEQSDSGAAPPTLSASAIQRLGLASLQVLSPYLRRECALVLPPEYEFSVIKDLYYAKIDPLLPILHAEMFDQHDTMDTVALKQCICLSASLDPSLRSRLRLPHTERILTPIEFRGCLAAAVKQSLDLGFIQNKVVLLQVCTLMALYVDKPSCSEVSTYYCAQAVHHAQTLGLHLGWPDAGSRGERSRRIFWCVWVLDRLNAATNGRPVLIHSRDMDRRTTDSVPEQIPSFRLVIRIARFLDEVISNYRPSPGDIRHAETVNSRTFEDLVSETESSTIGTTLLGKSYLHGLDDMIRSSLRAKQKALAGELSIS
jgi:hypothetical protein